MSEDKKVNGYYQTNITTSRGENITYTTEYAIDKLQQETRQLKEVIEKANNELITLIQIIMEQPSENAVDDLWLLNRLESISKILDKVKVGDKQ